MSEFYTLRSLIQGDVLLKEKEFSPNVYIVKYGKLNVFKTEGSRMVVLAQIDPGGFVGEMSHLGSAGGVPTASVCAHVDTEVIEIPAENLIKVLSANPVWMKALLSQLVSRLEVANAKIMSGQ